MKDQQLQFDMLSLEVLQLEDGDHQALERDALAAREVLEQGTGAGAEMRGWLVLPGQ